MVSAKGKLRSGVMNADQAQGVTARSERIRPKLLYCTQGVVTVASGEDAVTPGKDSPGFPAPRCRVCAILARMSAIPQPQRISVEEYLSTSYRPDCDYVDGEIEERNLAR